MGLCPGVCVGTPRAPWLRSSGPALLSDPFPISCLHILGVRLDMVVSRSAWKGHTDRHVVCACVFDSASGTVGSPDNRKPQDQFCRESLG